MTNKIPSELINHSELTKRQRREVEYHRNHRANIRNRLLKNPFSWDVLSDPSRRWWNAYWQMYEYLVNCDLKGKNALVVGCGYGEDALRLAKLGANVFAFDLSYESLQVAAELANIEALKINFDQMPAEKMRYGDSSFDYVIAVDILHHVDIPSTMKEIVRVSKPQAIFIINEVYSHSATNLIRHSSLVEKYIYPRMRKLIYRTENPYITADERKLDELDFSEITKHLNPPLCKKYFYFLVSRIVPKKYELFAKFDCLLLRIFKPIGMLLAGRILFIAHILK